jgi:DNA primase
MQDAKEEVRSRLAIEDVIGEYVQLKRSGRNFKGLSPFTGEKTPSFYVSPDKNIWHDFSSNKGGDVFSFVMEVEGLDFRGALEMLAQRAGVDLSSYDTKGAQAIAAQKRRFLEMHDLAARYYQHCLLQNKNALEYVFKKRGLSKEVVQLFRIGYAPNTPDALVSFLRKKGFTPQELSKAGLTNRRGGDLFRSRMVVPLMDATGQVIGFTGRILVDEPNAPKYLNTPQTLIYDKSRHVFGLSQAKEAIRKLDHAVIVEGNLDVVSSHQVAVSQVVATAGTAMTEQHLKALSRLTPNIRLAFDGDSAGLAATERAIPIAQKVGVDLTIISLPDDAKDPDELIQKDINLWKSSIDSAIPVVDWLFEQYSKREDMSTPRGRKQFTTAALEVVRGLKDTVEQEYYLNKIAEGAQTSIEAVKEKFSATPETDVPSTKAGAQVEKEEADEQQYQNEILAMAAVDEGVKRLLLSVERDIFTTEERQKAYDYFVGNMSNRGEDLKNIENYVTMLSEFGADEDYVTRSKEDLHAYAVQLIRKAVTEHIKTKKAALEAKLRVAEENGDKKAVDSLLRELNELIRNKKETFRA